MEDYFYFTMRNEQSGAVEFIGDETLHWWESWEEAVEFSSMNKLMPLKSDWKICGDSLIADSPLWGSRLTIQLRNTGYEQYFIESLKG